MKKLITLSLVIITVLFTSCKEDKNPSCTSVVGFTISQSFGTLNTVIDSKKAPSYQVKLVPVNAGPDQNGYGYNVTSNEASVSIDAEGYNIPTGNYWAYVRSECSENEYGEWYGPKPITIIPFCYTPYNLTVENGVASWQMNSASPEVEFYEVNYGIQGFRIFPAPNTKIGVTGDQNGGTYSGATLRKNTYYDFYVRAYCKNSRVYGDWIGPFAYLATQDQN